MTPAGSPLDAGWRDPGKTALLVLAVLLTGALAFTVPRAVATSRLLDENLRLQGHLQAVEQRMGEIDRILMRLRLYDAQLDSLASPDGDAGPLPEAAMSNAAPDGDLLDGIAAGMVAAEDGGLRPVSGWAASVEARTGTFLRMFEDAELGLDLFVGELESLEALRNALPSEWPTAGTLTSGYGWRRNPFGVRWRHHTGIDLGGERGDPVWSSGPGTVLRAGRSEGFGRVVEVDHGYGITTLYGHLARAAVSTGQRVRRGQRLGLVGTTGRSTGPHLHFEIRLDGHPVDPLDYLAPWRPAAGD